MPDSEPRLCPECGIEIPAHAPAGLCPKCLMRAGFEGQSVVNPARQPTVRAPLDGFRGFVPPAPEELAPRFPQLEILELIGKGGMGAVYKARQRGLDRLVAVKVLPPEVGGKPEFAERFTREARALARLSHPNIVAVHDFGQTEELYFFVMEYVDGVNLRQVIQAGGLTPKDVLAIVPQVCDALQFAHDEGIVHRDIKPENILIDKKGRVKIADFGLAKLLGIEAIDHRLTATQQVMGTLRYMSPEQMEGSNAVDHRADIYSLGVVFYELLTGELPIGRFAPPSQKVQIDVRLDEVVLRALDKEPERRYQHASDVRTDVDVIRQSAFVASGGPRSSMPEVGLPRQDPGTSEAIHRGVQVANGNPTATQLEREVLAYLPRLPVNAMFAYRNLTGVSIADARAAVEAIADRHGMRLGNWQAVQWNLIGIAAAAAVTAYFTLRLELSALILVPAIVLVFIIPYSVNAWIHRGLHRGRRDAWLAGCWSVVACSLIMARISLHPGDLLQRLSEATGVQPGRNDAGFLAGLFAILVLAGLAWLIRYLYRLQFAKPASPTPTGPMAAVPIKGGELRGWLIVAIATSLLTLAFFWVLGGLFLDAVRGSDGELVRVGSAWGLGSSTESVEVMLLLISGALLTATCAAWVAWGARFASSAHSAGEDYMATARRLVLGPALGLILMGTANLPVILAVILGLFGDDLFGKPWTWLTWWYAASLLGYGYWVWGAIDLIRGGAALLNLESLPKARSVARFALFWPIHLMVFLPVSIWVWSVLQRPEVQAAFPPAEALSETK